MKLLKVLVAALVLVAMVAPAIAEDRLSLSGEMRVRGWHDNSKVDDADIDLSNTWADQRLRIGGQLAVAEGVSITFRTDITETNWGGGGSDFGAGRMASTQQWDRAHIDLTTGMFHLRAGQQYLGTGTAFAFDTQEAGLALDIAAGVPVKLFYVLDNDNNDGNLGGSNADAQEFGIMVSPKGDSWKSSLFAVGQSKRNDDAEEVYLIGANAAFDLGAIKLVGELDFFTGDATENVDATGTQLFLDASMKATDALTVGGQFFYAAGDEDDEQYTGLGNGFNGWDPIFDVGTSLSNEAMDLGDNMIGDLLGTLTPAESLGGVFDWSGQNAGVVGGRLYANTMLGDTKLGGSVAYLETEEDNNIDADAMFYTVGLVYPVMANTSFQVQLQYSDADVEGVDVEIFQAGTGLFVNF